MFSEHLQLENSGDLPHFSNVHELGYFECLYFLMVTMSTVGYGDIVCLTKGGRFIQLLFLLIGLVRDDFFACWWINLSLLPSMILDHALPSLSTGWKLSNQQDLTGQEGQNWIGRKYESQSLTRITFNKAKHKIDSFFKNLGWVYHQFKPIRIRPSCKVERL